MNLINNSNNSGANNNNANNTNNNWIIGASLLMVFIVGVLVGGGIYYVINKSSKSPVDFTHLSRNINISQDNSNDILEQKNDKLSNRLPDKVLEEGHGIDGALGSSAFNINNSLDGEIAKGDIQWFTARDIKQGDLHLTTASITNGCDNRIPNNKCDLSKVKSSGGVQYYYIGTVVSGKYKDMSVVLIKATIYGYPKFFLVLSDWNKVVFIADNLEKSKWIKQQIENVFVGGSLDKIISNIKIADLDYPDQFIWTNKNGRKISFIKNKYDQAFFVPDKLREAFTHPQYGKVFVTKSQFIGNKQPTKFYWNRFLRFNSKENKFVENYLDIFNTGDFYIQAPDQLALSYKMIPDIFQDNKDKNETHGKLMVTWNDDRSNDIEYGFNCAGLSACDVTEAIDFNDDLTEVGVLDNGDILYGFNNYTTPYFQKLYNNDYWVKDGKKKNIQEFLAMNPQVFWKDPFGRLLALTRSDIVSPAEMGKPVIYLYPEKPMDVNVQVEPNEGISVSEPKYSIGGWNVFARPSGELTFAGQKYPYLFWEGSSDVSYQQSERGWVIAKKNLNQFFDDKLKKLGLIQKEVDDFKEFWLPEMTKHNKPYYFITFLPQRKINQLAPLTITPKPDTIIRIMMDYRELDKYEEVVGFNIKTPRREGFTAVEWGGMLK